MKYLKISNKVEIEANAFHLIGACTKHDQVGKIGYFGSGLKYAIAVLLREGVKFEVYAGLKKIDITHSPDTLRGHSFDVISIDGRKTSMTTSMGPKWKMWQAIRELYCNALDEEHCNLSQVDEIVPVAGETSFYIDISSHLEIELLLADWDKYFSVDRPVLLHTDIGNVLNRIDGFMSVYRKGIRCYDEQVKSLYDYDINELQLNESRLVEYGFYIGYKVSDLWTRFASEDMIKTLIRAYKHPDCVKDSFEHNLVFPLSSTFNNNWKTVLQDKILIPFSMAGHFEEACKEPNAVILNGKLIRALKKCFGDSIIVCYADYNPNSEYIVKPMGKRIKFILKECLAFLEEVNIKITYPVKVAVFEKKKILGAAIDNEIILSEKVFGLGKKQVVATIMEEHMHLDSECNDETREFQDYIINQMLTMLENKHGIFL